MAFVRRLGFGYKFNVWLLAKKALDELNLKKGIWKWSAYELSNHDNWVDDFEEVNNAHTPDWTRSQAREKEEEMKNDLIKMWNKRA